jgi:hemoglobin
MSTLFEKLGGQPTIEQVVDDFHKRILADSTLKPFFATTDMAKQRNLQVAFFSKIFEGPDQYKGRPMEKTHMGMSLKQPHFDAILKHLSDAMAARGASADDTKAALAKVTGMKDSILNK